MAKINVFIKDPGKKPRHVAISNTLENLQKNVGGHIEHVTIAQNMGILVNEEGIISGLPYNCTLFGMNLYGTVIFVGHDGEEFSSVPISWQSFKKLFPHLWKEELNE